MAVLPVARPFTAARQTITHWGAAAEIASGAIKPGSWVMTGARTFRNWQMSGTGGFLGIGAKYGFKDAITTVVPRSALRWPSGWE